jgi:hypothetical protein
VGDMARKESKWYDNEESRWARVEEVMQLFGTEEDKTVWDLCRCDLADLKRIAQDYYELPLDGRYP